MSVEQRTYPTAIFMKYLLVNLMISYTFYYTDSARPSAETKIIEAIEAHPICLKSVVCHIGTTSFQGPRLFLSLHFHFECTGSFF